MGAVTGIAGNVEAGVTGAPAFQSSIIAWMSAASKMRSTRSISCTWYCTVRRSSKIRFRCSPSRSGGQCPPYVWIAPGVNRCVGHLLATLRRELQDEGLGVAERAIIVELERAVEAAQFGV